MTRLSKKQPYLRPALGQRWKHVDTPKKTQLRAIKRFCEAEGIEHTNRQLFKHCDIKDRTGYYILKDTDRSFHNNPFTVETRGRNRLLSEEQLDQLEAFLWNNSFEARRLPWSDLCNAAGLEWPERTNPPSARTIQRALGQRDWRKCITCTRSWVSESLATNRVRQCREILLERGFSWDYWTKIRFSAEVHFKFGPEGRILIIRKSGERYCPDCIHHRDSPDRNEQVCLSAWAAVGFNFKSQLVWYDTNNSNGAITLKAYRDQILEPVVGQWLRDGHDFILAEDGTAGHGGQSNSNIVAKWKENNGLKYFFNCAGSPDLAPPIENAWRGPESIIQQHPIWDEETLKEKAVEGWEALKQETINEWAVSMPSRLLDVIRLEGQLTGH
ncbi:hypothetical protein HD806DRAFT_536188 [Xylariaceae sp. AK1471]|nr:hypothetical protein HD806DRAFT_536188 [Xylariaceae sp. AK1471]